MSASPFVSRPAPDVFIDPPFLRGADERHYPNQGAARRAAIAELHRLSLQHGPGFRIVHEQAHAAGQLPHYHIERPDGSRVAGHFFYGARRLRRTYRGRPNRESGPPFEYRGLLPVGENSWAETAPANALARFRNSRQVRLMGQAAGQLADLRIYNVEFDSHLAKLQENILRSWRNDPMTAGRYYESLVATQVSGMQVFRLPVISGRYKLDLPGAVEITFQGYHSPLNQQKKNQLEAGLRHYGRITLILPRLSACSFNELASLLVMLNMSGKRHVLNVLQTASSLPGRRCGP